MIGDRKADVYLEFPHCSKTLMERVYIFYLMTILKQGELTCLELLVEKQSEGANPLLVYKLQMKGGENRLTPPMNGELQSSLDTIQANLCQHPPTQRAVLMLTGTGKYFSLGLDLAAYPSQRDFEASYGGLVARLLIFPLTTIAVLNGHVIAGGFVLAMACDYRIMNGRRGFLAMNEIDLPASIPRGMASLVQHRVADPKLAREILQQGKRFTASQLMDRGGPLDYVVANEEDLEVEALKLATEVAHTIGKTGFVELIKKTCNCVPLADLTRPETFDHFAFTRSHASKI